ncbi:hypothetical protein [Candidatus Entotheonella palauensis]|uniref:hypothetical protein n=1 Tax=Candidatus Entotheonella palauensis TaxID=93172 RepID=UPI000B800A86|nr:hypothetical protein [Candidatus Entotheonella palauensis]
MRGWRHGMGLSQVWRDRLVMQGILLLIMVLAHGVAVAQQSEAEAVISRAWCQDTFAKVSSNRSLT